MVNGNKDEYKVPHGFVAKSVICLLFTLRDIVWRCVFSEINIRSQFIIRFKNIHIYIGIL